MIGWAEETGGTGAAMAYHMLFSFNLAEGVSASDIARELRRFDAEMVGLGLMEATSPLGKRHRHPVLDTATGNPHEFFAKMRFRDLAQANAAVTLFQSDGIGAVAPHVRLIRMTRDAIFLCFEDHA